MPAHITPTLAFGSVIASIAMAVVVLTRLAIAAEVGPRTDISSRNGRSVNASAARESKRIKDMVAYFREASKFHRLAIVAVALIARMNKAGTAGASVYVCRNYACELPVTDPSKLAELLQ